MDPFSEENILLKDLQDFYTNQQKKSQEKEKFQVQKENAMKKSYILQIFFDYNLIDNCGYNIFQISEFLHQLSPESDELDLQQFFKLIFYLYKTHTINKGLSDSEIVELSMDDINDISSHIKPNKESYNIINLLIDQYKNNTKVFNFSVPDLSNDIFDNILNYEFLSLSSKYMNELKNTIYMKYAEKITEKDMEIYYINFAKINKFLVDLHITSLFKRDILFQYMQIFLKIKSFVLDDPTFNDEFMAFFEKNISIEEIKEIFDKMILTVDDFNFNFSSIALFVSILAYNLESSKTLVKEEKIRFFYEEILNLKITEDANLSQEKIDEEKEEDLFDDYVPESIIFNKAKENFGKYTKDDIELVSDFLLTLDKVLPPPDENILNFANEYSYPTKKLYINEEKKVIPKFPVEKLAVEIEEEKERKIEEQEKRLIEKAKKAKKNQKEKVENPYDTVMGEVPSKELSDIKYLGHEKILTLTHRLIKHTYKEILPNSRVYPSLLKEVLLIPPLCPQKCIESIVESMEEQVNGRYEMAIRRLERAQDYLPKDTTQIDWQTDLFFNLTFGSLYETLNFDVVAMKYYNECVRITEKLIGEDTDTALPYCFIGELFIKLQEYNWALRCFLKAKKVREETIGGETPDTASIYNNLGVVSYYLESYLPAKGYFKLAYEIYKKMLGLTHPRTLLIKSNLTKMNQLNFNKEIEFKTLSKYATPAQLIKNPKKKK